MIAKQELGHGQWLKQAIVAGLILTLILMNLCLGSPDEKSIIGIRLCGGWYWGLQGIYVIICVVTAIWMVSVNKESQKLKKKYGVNYLQGEIDFEDGNSVCKLLAIGFVGGWVAGAMGLGGGSIYNPALLSLGVHPRVAGSTGMYLVFFSTINAVVVDTLNGYL